MTMHSVCLLYSNYNRGTLQFCLVILKNSNGYIFSLTLDKPIKEILGPDFYFYTDILTTHCTLRDLLSHSTGIPDFFLPLMAILPKDETRKEFVR